MFLVQLHVTTTTGLPPGHGDGPVLQDLLWAHAAPWHQLEHITVCPTFDGFAVVLFVAASSHDRAAAQAAGLIAGVGNSGLLQRYRVSGAR
ncbi:hypothetical protein [Streptomyces sp. OM5714]|uniref:hypothetical protein n=1 Tax=Streptomyces sp. OM5714 TaxID=2602736 RepID=UPI0013D902DF|nr:hypothetical protein [Streptomyces sp. OM5714]